MGERRLLSARRKGPARAWPLLFLALLALFALLWPGRRPDRPPPRRLVQVVMGFAWPELGRTAVFGSPWRLAELEALLDGGERSPAAIDHRFPYWTVLLHFSDGAETELILSRALEIFDPQAQARWRHPRLETHFALLTGEFGRQVFADPLPWPEVNRLFPPRAVAEVADLETGLTFRVRRRGGESHADVEPLTAADAAVLREVYGGKWSWKRRAAVVTVDGRRLAASMNGMPHGEGSIRDNEFPGHFCLHFAGSRVHRTWRIDRGHQLMVAKAAGRLAEVLDAASPAELVALVLTAVNHHDRTTFRYAGDGLASDLWSALTATVRHLDLIATRPGATGELAAAVEADVLVYYREPDPDRPHRVILSIPLSRSHPHEGWRVGLESLRSLFDIPASGPAAPALPDMDCGCEAGAIPPEPGLPAGRATGAPAHQGL